MTPRQIAVRRAGPVLILATLLVPSIVLHGRMPDPAAIHWGVNGVPNGHAPWWVGFIPFTVLFGLCAAVLASSGKTQPRRTAAFVYGIGGILIAANTITIWANVDRPSWSAARHLPNVALFTVGLLLAGVVLGAIGWLVAGKDPVNDQPQAASRPSVGLKRNETAVWSGSAHNWWMLLLMPLGVALITAQPYTYVAVFPLLIALLAVLLCRLQVTVGPTGVTVRYGLLSWPSRHFEVADITSAVTIDDLVPLQYGGWGWRRRAGGGFIVRRGEALVLHRRRGAQVIYTVDGAAAAAGLVNDYVARQASVA